MGLGYDDTTGRSDLVILDAAYGGRRPGGDGPPRLAVRQTVSTAAGSATPS